MRILFLLMVLLLLSVGSVQAEESLQEMIDSAAPNAHIRLGDKEYHGPIVISKPITISGGSQTTIVGSGQGNVVTIAANGVEITSVSISGSGSTGQETAILIKGDQAKIDQVKVDHVHAGVYITSNRNQLTNMRIKGESDLLVSKRGNGIHLNHSSGNLIQGNQIIDVQDGLYIDHANDNTITQNLITNSRYGFHLMYSQGNQFERNDVSDSVTGAMVMETSKSTFKQNRFVKQRDTRGYGMLLFNCKACDVQENIISNNTHGLGIDTITDSKIEANTFSSNSVGIDLFGPLRDSSISRNSFIGNVQQVVLDKEITPGQFQDQGIGNYWDDYDGLDLTGDQIGETGYFSRELLFVWVKKAPVLQILFGSPSHSLMESLANAEHTVDPYPLTKPLNEGIQTDKAASEQSTGWFATISLCLLALGALILRRRTA